LIDNHSSGHELRAFMDLESSLLCSQKFAIGP